jgi:protein SCO1/2
LALLNQVDKALKNETNIVLPKTVFVSVDPERDTVEQLAEYVSYFNSEFTGVTGSLENLQALTKSLGVAFGKEGGTEGDEYEMYHSARIMLIDPEARLKALLSSSHGVSVIVSDYIKITGS